MSSPKTACRLSVQTIRFWTYCGLLIGLCSACQERNSIDRVESVTKKGRALWNDSSKIHAAGEHVVRISVAVRLQAVEAVWAQDDAH